ncbi:MAG: transglutaminase, partial [Proteobacteria bacterium]
MIKFSEIPFRKIRDRLKVKKPWDSVIIFLLNVLIATPIFIILHQTMIDPEWPYEIDRILIFVGLLAVIQVILYLLRSIIIICLVGYALFLV